MSRASEGVRRGFPVLAGLLVLAASLGLVQVGNSAVGPAPAGDELAVCQQLALTCNRGPERLDQAIACYEKALALTPGGYEILWSLAELYHMKGQFLGEDRGAEKLACWEKGASYAERAIAVNPEGREGHFYVMANIGAAAEHEGLLFSVRKFMRIKREMDRTLELDPAWPRALVAKGRFLAEMPGVLGGSEEEAARLYRKAAALDPHCSVGLVFLAELQAEREDYAGAFSSLEKLLFCRNPGNCANWALVDCPRALAVLEKICAEMPTPRNPICGNLSAMHCRCCPP